MQGKRKLPIEDDRELLADYGRVFAWINSVEYMLEQVILFKGKLHLIDKDLREKLIERKTLGQKIELANGLLRPELIAELKLLNAKRVLMAHNATAQEIKINGNQQNEGSHVLVAGEERIILNLGFLSEIIELAQSLSGKLHAVFLEGVKK